MNKDALLSGKRHLFALSIVDDALADWSEEWRVKMILDITRIKETMLKEHQPADSDRKHTPKVKASF